MLFYFRLLVHADNTDLYFYIWCFFWSVRIVGSLCGPDRWFSATLGGPGGRNGARQPPPSSIVSSSSSVVSLLRDFVFLSLPAQCCHCLCLYIFIRPCLFDARSLWVTSSCFHVCCKKRYLTSCPRARSPLCRFNVLFLFIFSYLVFPSLYFCT